ncbi:MAG: hypothetical protein KF878_02995 [Planctomycetes bacterium]|nr:hypothetical protein [Planctomycetota bacterium]
MRLPLALAAALLLGGPAAAQDGRPRPQGPSVRALLEELVGQFARRDRSFDALAYGVWSLGEPAVRPLVELIVARPDLPRRDLARLLAHLGPAGEGALVTLALGKDALVSAAAATVLAAEGQPSALPALVDAFAEQERREVVDVAARAATAICVRTGEVPFELQRRLWRIVEEARAAAEKGRWDPRTRPALHVLVSSGDAEAARTLLALLGDRTLRRDALSLLVELEPAVDEPDVPLLELLRQVLDAPNLRYERGLALQALTRLGGFHVVTDLLELAAERQEADPRFTAEVLRLLNGMAGARFERLQDWQCFWEQVLAPAVSRDAELLEELPHADLAQAAKLVGRLSPLPHPRTLSALRALVDPWLVEEEWHDEQGQVAAAVCRALAHQGRRAAGLLIDLLQAPGGGPAVKEQASRALQTIARDQVEGAPAYWRSVFPEARTRLRAEPEPEAGEEPEGEEQS